MDMVTTLAGGKLIDLADFASSQPVIPERTIAGRRQYRTIWISDVHLGTRGCNAEMLIDFLDHVDSETLYLVGDQTFECHVARAQRRAGQRQAAAHHLE